MYQIEVKRHLIKYLFPPSEGSDVSVDLDPMEHANGGHHAVGKREIAENCEAWLVAAGVEIRLPRHGDERPDLVAVHPSEGTFVVEVEGESSRAPGVSVDSALAQVLRRMPEMEDRVVRAVAVPNSPRWKRQLDKIAPWVISRVNLRLFLVSANEVRQSVTDSTSCEHDAC